MLLLGVVDEGLSGEVVAGEVGGESEARPTKQQAEIAHGTNALVHAATMYRAGPVAEKVNIEFRRGGSSSLRSAELSFWVDRGEMRASPTPRRLKLDLGRLLVSVEGERFVAVHKHNPTLYYESRLPAESGLTLASLAQVIPSLPLPQIAWALDAETPSIESALRALDDSLPIDHPQVETDSDELGTTPTVAIDLVGDAGSQFGATIDRVSGRLIEFWFGFSVGDPPHRERALARAKVTTLDPGDPAGWMIQTAGRIRVQSLTELKALAPAIKPGFKVPNLGLMSAELEPTPLDADFIAASSAESARRRSKPLPALGVFLIYDVARADMEDVRTGVQAIMECRPLHFDTSGTRWSPGPRVERLIPVFEPGRFTTASINSENARWTDAAWLFDEPVSPARTPDSKPPLRSWSAVGSAVMSELVPNLRSALIVCDAERTLLAIIPLDGRRPERISVTRELREALRAAWEKQDESTESPTP
jgi:hypothetical protein